MAAKSNGRFYVYRIADERGTCLYIGKGSGYRAKNQQRKFGRQVEILERFTSEAAAYRRETELIARDRPLLNKHKGGNGSRSMVRVERTPSWQIEMEQYGLRRWAARALLMKGEQALSMFLSSDDIAGLRRVHATV